MKFLAALLLISLSLTAPAFAVDTWTFKVEQIEYKGGSNPEIYGVVKILVDDGTTKIEVTSREYRVPYTQGMTLSELRTLVSVVVKNHINTDLKKSVALERVAETIMNAETVVTL